MTGPTQCAITAAVLDWAAADEQRHAWIADCLAHHYRHDWGDVDRHDWAMNDRAASVRAGRLLSAYTPTGGLGPVDGELWIITDDLEDPDTLTTILWKHEY